MSDSPEGKTPTQRQRRDRLERRPFHHLASSISYCDVGGTLLLDTHLVEMRQYAQLRAQPWYRLLELPDPLALLLFFCGCHPPLALRVREKQTG